MSLTVGSGSRVSNTRTSDSSTTSTTGGTRDVQSTPAEARVRAFQTPSADADAVVARPAVDARLQAGARQAARGAEQALQAKANASLPGQSTAAAELQNTNRQAELNPAVTNAPGARSPEALNQVIDQFDVANNPRYTPGRGKTYCNIFASDVMNAMGAPLPHWVDQQGNPAKQGDPGAWEMNANATHRWLNNQGADHGWRQITAEEAQARANEGYPAIAIWKNPDSSRSGHVGVIRPGEATDLGPAMAQAGRANSNNTNVHATPAGFGAHEVQYWTHD